MMGLKLPLALYQYNNDSNGFHHAAAESFINDHITRKAIDSRKKNESRTNKWTIDFR
jgi:hypothetical protein